MTGNSPLWVFRFTVIDEGKPKEQTVKSMLENEDPTLIFTTFLHKSATKIQRQVRAILFRERLRKSMLATAELKEKRSKAAKTVQRMMRKVLKIRMLEMK